MALKGKTKDAAEDTAGDKGGDKPVKAKTTKAATSGDDAAKGAATKKKTPVKRGDTKPTTDKPNALQTPVNVSAELEAVVGKGPMSRGQVTSKVWVYIKEKKLQAKDDGRAIEPDETLGKVIGAERISMFKMTAAVSKHITA